MFERELVVTCFDPGLAGLHSQIEAESAEALGRLRAVAEEVHLPAD